MSMRETLSTFEILREASSVELNNIELVDENACIEEVRELLGDMDTMDEPVLYTEEMVNITAPDNGTNDLLVEYESLHKLMEYHRVHAGFCDEKMAIKKLSEHYNVEADRFIVVIESEENHMEVLDSLKLKLQKESDPKKRNLLKAKMATIKNNLNKLKGKGIRTIKKG